MPTHPFYEIPTFNSTHSRCTRPDQCAPRLPFSVSRLNNSILFTLEGGDDGGEIETKRIENEWNVAIFAKI